LTQGPGGQEKQKVLSKKKHHETKPKKAWSTALRVGSLKGRRPNTKRERWKVKIEDPRTPSERRNASALNDLVWGATRSVLPK